MSLKFFALCVSLFCATAHAKATNAAFKDAYERQLLGFDSDDEFSMLGMGGMSGMGAMSGMGSMGGRMSLEDTDDTGELNSGDQDRGIENAGAGHPAEQVQAEIRTGARDGGEIGAP